MEMDLSRTAEEVFDDWALDYHAPGMEDEHWPNVHRAFELIPESNGLYLEVGVGNGYGLFYMATNQYKRGRCLGIDVSRNMVDLSEKRVTGLDNVTVRQADFMELHALEERPDVIFSMEVFYYLPDIGAGMAHAFDILEPGGTLMILVNHFLERPESHDWPNQLGTRMQLWSAEQYREGMKAAGFADVQQRILGGKEAANDGTLATWGIKPTSEAIESRP